MVVGPILTGENESYLAYSLFSFLRSSLVWRQNVTFSSAIQHAMPPEFSREVRSGVY